MKNNIWKLIKDFKGKLFVGSIQWVIMSTFSILIVTTIVFVGGVLFIKFTNTIDNNAKKSSYQTMIQVERSLQYYLQGMSDVLNIIDGELYNNDDTGIDILNNQINMTLALRKDIVTIALFSENGELLASNSGKSLKIGLDVTQEPWFYQVAEKNGDIYKSSSHVQNLFRGEHQWVVSISKQVKAKINGEISKVIVLVDMNFSSIDQLCSQVDLGEKGYVYIVDSEGNIIYHKKQQLVYSGIMTENIDFVINAKEGSYIENNKGTKTVVSIKSVGKTDWKVVGISYYDEIMSSKTEIYSFFVTVVISVILIAFILSVIISVRISLPIKNLEKVMRRIENGDLDIDANISGEKEVMQLAKTFNIMIAKIRYLMEQIVKENEEKRKSEIKALQAQINPHFLYNTLDSIVWMAENDENKGVITMVTALANLFRTSISRGKDLITIKDELEHAKSYLVIQQMRYGDKFMFSIEADEKILEYKTLKIILQPIIENAIYHGIVKSMVDCGNIIIKAEEKEDKIILSVIDNGNGMSQEKIQGLLNRRVNNEINAGIGVNNVHERIRLYFGESCGIEIESEIEVGTTVKINLPKVR